MLLISIIRSCPARTIGHNIYRPPGIKQCHSIMATASSTSNDTTPYTLSFYVPTESTSTVLAAVHSTGAGSYPGGLYDKCAFMTMGTGTFRSLEGSTPAIGTVGEVERVEEHRVEVLCVGRECMLKAVQKLKEAHPYEQVAYFVVKGEDV